MRCVVIALAALVLGVMMGSPVLAQDKDKKTSGDKVKEIKSGTEVKGKLIKVDVKKKRLVQRTSPFSIREIPVKGKLLVQQGQKGRPVPETLEGARRLVGREVVVIIRAGGTIIIIILK
jgi:hypothetical protein